MAIKRKTATKPTARPTPKPLPRPKPAPLDLVRNPNFDAAMAQQNYDNFIAEQRARIGTGNQAPQVGGGMGGKILTQIPEASQGFPDDMQKFRNAALTGIGERMPTQIPEASQGFPDDMQKFRNAALTGIGERMPTQIPEAQQGAMASQYQNPQRQQQQMQNYQNFLQQGMQNINTMNQGAMNNFANMQPGMQATQTASRATPNQTMPVAGMGMQQPKQTQPRKFSTVRNSPARFG
jgi:hypothetical protein